MPDGPTRDDLLRRTRDLKIHVAALRRALLPSPATINHLPDELLVLIFQATQRPKHWNYDDDEDRHPCTEPPTAVFTNVCRRWRTTALSAPVLWSTICAKLGTPNVFARTQVYLERSKAHALELHLEFCSAETLDRGAMDLDLRQVRALFDDVLPHSDRWRTLFINAYTTSQREYIGRLLKQLALPMLATFQLVADYEPIDEDEDEPARPFDRAPVFTGGAPLLRTVALYGCTWPWCAPPLTGVTSIDMRHTNPGTMMSYADLRTLLAEAPALAELSLREDPAIAQPVHSAHLKPLDAPSLRRLALDEDGAWLLERLRAPALATLELEAGYMARSFLAFLARAPQPPFPALRALTLHAAFGGAVAATCGALVEKLPALESITLSCESDDESSSDDDDGAGAGGAGRGIAPVLSAAAHTPGGWPRLQRLTAAGADKAPLVAFVHSRDGGPFNALRFAPGFVRALRLDYPVVVACFKERGISVEAFTENPYVGEWEAHMPSWEDGSEESVFGGQLSVVNMDAVRN